VLPPLRRWVPHELGVPVGDARVDRLLEAGVADFDDEEY
jgi:hypothetical protein